MSRFFQTLLMMTACALVGLATETTRAKEKQINLLANGSFEKSNGSRPVGWTESTWSGKGQFGVVATGRGGGRCVLLDSTEGADIAWSQNVAVAPETHYRLSGWVKTDDLRTSGGGNGALLNVHGHTGRTKAIKGTSDWTPVSTVFYSGRSRHLMINCLFGGWGKAKGKAWFDDISLVAVPESEMEKMPLPTVALTTPPEETKATATIDLSKKGQPMSDYIYSQFIEHLGRCIYGGIWAEMLEDRKFYNDVNAGHSFWKAFGGKGKVTMVEKDSFVGDHTPLVRTGGGIIQSGLSLVKGKKYPGYIWLKSSGPSASATVTLDWGGGSKAVTIDGITGEYKKFPFEFTAGANCKDGSIAVKITDGNASIGTLSLMPGDNINGMRADTLALLKQLDAPLYRWPGGNFVSGYDWRDGIGPRDRRPPRKNPAWTGIEHNDFGTDEFIAFCRHLDTEPLIVVNTGFGDAYSAAQWLEYVNGPANTIGGSWRVNGGHPEPFKVRWWGIGNEMYGPWQLGHMSLKHYVLKHNRVVKKMLKVDPTIKTLAVGNPGAWSEGMLKNCSHNMDILSLHFYCGGKDNVVEHYKQVPNRIRTMAQGHRELCKKHFGDKIMPVAMDEWNYWYGPHLYGELGTRYFLKDALGIAAGIHEFSRNTDVYAMAQYAQTVNVIGCIKTNGTDAAFATTGLALKMYKDHFGSIPVPVGGTADKMDLDVAAMLSDDKKALTVGVVNPHGVAVPIQLDIKGVKPSSKGKTWVISGDHPLLYNEPGKKDRVTIKEQPVTFQGTITVPPLSASIYQLELD